MNQEKLDALGITMETRWTRRRPDHLMSDMPAGSNHYGIKLSREGLPSQAFFYSMGPAHKDGPKLTDVLYSLVSDAISADEYDFDGFCREFGYERKQGRSWTIYEACRRANKQLAELFPDVNLYELEEIVREE